MSKEEVVIRSLLEMIEDNRAFIRDEIEREKSWGELNTYYQGFDHALELVKYMIIKEATKE